MTGKLPRVGVEPVVWDLDLVPIDDLLLEDAVPVPQPIAPGWIVEGGEAVEEASGESPQAAVAKGSIVFLPNDVLNAETEILETR